MQPSTQQNPTNPNMNCLNTMLDKLKSQVVGAGRTAMQLGKDDPRRIVHGVKVGLAIALVSMLYCYEPLFEGFGVSATWAVLTVVVVFEFSVGATLGKGVNRVAATSLAAMLAVGAHRVASSSGNKAKAVLIGFFLFLIGAVATFLRFFPKLKARYDYGLMIFILTFSLICVSGYRDEVVLDEAHRRISTIIIGSCAAAAVCILICPVWAGKDLHNLTADNVEKLANFLQEFGAEYFKKPGDGISHQKKELMEAFKSIFISKKSEDLLVNFAKWEPPHGGFRYSHPWKQYQKINKQTLHCAFIVEALNRYLHSQNQAPKEVKAKIEQVCRKMSCESGKALKESSMAMRSMTHPPSAATTHIQNSQCAAKTLESLLETGFWAGHRHSDVIAAGAVASLLLDAVCATDTIAGSVQELAKLARFKSSGDTAVVAPAPETPADHVITVKEEEGLSPGDSLRRYKEPASLDLPHQSAE